MFEPPRCGLKLLSNGLFAQCILHAKMFGCLKRTNKVVKHLKVIHTAKS